MVKRLLQIDERDNVAVALEEILPGDRCSVSGNGDLKVLDKVPFGHKVALEDIPPGEKVVKYGSEIGRATVAIRRGSWVHVHNLSSDRGRVGRTG